MIRPVERAVPLWMMALALAACSDRGSGAPANPPWYPSLAAFEHYDSGRTHLFAEAKFGGDFTGRNVVTTLRAPTLYPSAYNITYLDADHAFVYGGGYGDGAGSIGSYVARIDPETLAPIWYSQLVDTATSGEWDYPGVMGILDDGLLYVMYGYRFSKIDPATGATLATLELPTGGAAPGDTSFNGFNATADGVVVAKSIYRQAGCTIQGPDALTHCPDSSDVPDSLLVTIDPGTMQVIDQATLPGHIIGRATVGAWQGREYVYLFPASTFIRYGVQAGMLTSDSAWNPGTLLQSGQTVGWALVVIGEWVVGQCNGLPASAPLTVYAVSQDDSGTLLTLQPFVGDRIPPLVEAAFGQAAPGAAQAVSWIPAAVSADPDTDTIFAMDALPGKIAAVRVTASGLETVWKVDQTTTEFIAIIGPQGQRAIVASDIPGEEVPGANSQDEVVWRDAASGRELARSPRLPTMTSGTMVQPYYDGEMFFPALSGALHKLQPAPAPRVGAAPTTSLE